MYLTDQQQAILNGAQGETMAKVMQTLVMYGEAFGADKNGMEYKIDTDSVILSVGYKSAPIAPKDKHVHIIGDANKVGNLRTVIWGAWDVCMKL